MARGVRLKGIKRKTVKGRVYTYRLVRGKHVPLPNLPENHPEFLQAYIDAETIVPKDSTLAALIVQFIGSRDFKRRKDSTRAVWRRRLDAISANYGKAPVEKLETQHINKALRKLTPGAARSERTIWRALMEYAVDESWRKDNPARDARVEKYESEPHPTWTQGEIVRFRAYWPEGSPERQAFEAIYWTGARCVDAARIGWQNVSGGVLEFEQAKTGGIAYVPVTAPVDSFLEADRRLFLKCVAPEMLFIQARGRARSVKGLSQFVAKSARSAKIPQRTAHGLRKARAVALAENGWTPHQIGAWTGHESLSEITHYTRDANKRAMITGKPSGKLFEGKP